VQQAGGEEAAGFESAASTASAQANVGAAVASLPGQVGLEPSFAAKPGGTPTTTPKG